MPLRKLNGKIDSDGREENMLVRQALEVLGDEQKLTGYSVVRGKYVRSRFTDDRGPDVSSD